MQEFNKFSFKQVLDRKILWMNSRPQLWIIQVQQTLQLNLTIGLRENVKIIAKAKVNIFHLPRVEFYIRSFLYHSSCWEF